MQIEKRSEVIKDLLIECEAAAGAKGRAYSGDDDSLANFKRNGERLGLSKYQILSVYANKHIDTINNAIKFHPEVPVDLTEGLKGRIIDVINYMTILYALLYEDNLVPEKQSEN